MTGSTRLPLLFTALAAAGFGGCAGLQPGNGPSLADAVAESAAANPSPVARPSRPDERLGTAEMALRDGYAAESAGRTDEALAAYRRVLLAAPESPAAHHRLGVLLDQAGNFVTAEQHYRMAARSRPDDPDLLGDLGYSYLMQGRLDEAERELRAAVAVRPDHRRSLEHLAAVYAERGERDRAEYVLRGTGTPAEIDAKLAGLFDRPVIDGMPGLDDGSSSEAFFAESRNTVTPPAAATPPAGADPVRVAAASPVTLGTPDGFAATNGIWPPPSTAVASAPLIRAGEPRFRTADPAVRTAAADGALPINRVSPATVEAEPATTPAAPVQRLWPPRGTPVTPASAAPATSAPEVAVPAIRPAAEYSTPPTREPGGALWPPR